MSIGMMVCDLLKGTNVQRISGEMKRRQPDETRNLQDDCVQDATNGFAPPAQRTRGEGVNRAGREYYAWPDSFKGREIMSGVGAVGEHFVSLLYCRSGARL
jgi:hypothetical protein